MPTVVEVFRFENASLAKLSFYQFFLVLFLFSTNKWKIHWMPATENMWWFFFCGPCFCVWLYECTKFVLQLNQQFMWMYWIGLNKKLLPNASWVSIVSVQLILCIVYVYKTMRLTLMRRQIRSWWAMGKKTERAGLWLGGHCILGNIIDQWQLINNH